MSWKKWHCGTNDLLDWRSGERGRGGGGGGGLECSGTAGVCGLEFEKVLGRQARDTAGVQPAFCGLRFTAKETDQSPAL